MTGFTSSTALPSCGVDCVCVRHGGVTMRFTVSVWVAVAMPATCMYSLAWTLIKLPTTSPPLVSVVSAAASLSTSVAWTPATPGVSSADPAEPSVACV